MIGRAGIVTGAALSLALQGIAGLVLFAVLFVALMSLIGAIHRAWYR